MIVMNERYVVEMNENTKELGTWSRVNVHTKGKSHKGKMEEIFAAKVIERRLTS